MGPIEFGARNFPDGAAMQDRGLIDGRERAPSRKIAASRFGGKTRPNGFAGERKLRAAADLSAADSTAVYLAHMTDELANSPVARDSIRRAICSIWQSSRRRLARAQDDRTPPRNEAERRGRGFLNAAWKAHSASEGVPGRRRRELQIADVETEAGADAGANWDT